MKVAGIIAEYNPFHNGHFALMQAVRRAGAETVAIVMSGNFTQRGEPALFDKWARARAAILCGADVVAELPTRYAAAPAQEFAAASVFLLSRLGADTICCGSECGNTAQLRQAALACDAAEAHPLLRQGVQEGLSYPQARDRAIAALAGEETAALLRRPNNLLAAEYQRAIQHTAPALALWTIPRAGVQHDDAAVQGRFASASWLREALRRDGPDGLSAFVPEELLPLYQREWTGGRVIDSSEAFSRILLAVLRRSTPEQLRTIRGMTEGLEHRILRAARQAATADELLARIATRRYPNARLRRLLLDCLLEIPKEAYRPPQYLRVLACSRRGARLLRQARQQAGLPVTPKFAQLARAGFADALLEERATALYGLMTRAVQPGDQEYRRGPFLAIQPEHPHHPDKRRE